MGPLAARRVLGGRPHPGRRLVPLRRRLPGRVRPGDPGRGPVARPRAVRAGGRDRRGRPPSRGPATDRGPCPDGLAGEEQPTETLLAVVLVPPMSPLRSVAVLLSGRLMLWWRGRRGREPVLHLGQRFQLTEVQEDATAGVALFQ